MLLDQGWGGRGGETLLDGVESKNFFASCVVPLLARMIR
jgi:hypothetical protein